MKEEPFGYMNEVFKNLFQDFNMTCHEPIELISHPCRLKGIYPVKKLNKLMNATNTTNANPFMGFGQGTLVFDRMWWDRLEENPEEVRFEIEFVIDVSGTSDCLHEVVFPEYGYPARQRLHPKLRKFICFHEVFVWARHLSEPVL